jgi:hypothetical protein
MSFQSKVNPDCKKYAKNHEKVMNEVFKDVPKEVREQTAKEIRNFQLWEEEHHRKERGLR